MNRCSATTLSGARCRNIGMGKCCHVHVHVHSRARSPTRDCRKKLQEKIRINMEEYHSGRWSSPKQAIAVSYSQVSRKYPKCVFKSNKKR